MESSDSRFKSLIEPIKDLAANWDIDIADSLNDYLDELENLKISLDHGETQLNFAEAALLIQGSAAVYSKKVEYLYQLVIQSIEFITRKKSNVLSKGKNGKDAADTSVFEDELLIFGSDPSFLLLDHIIEEGTNIDLKVDPEVERSRLSNDSFSNSLALNKSHISLSLLHSALNDENGGSTLKLTSSYIDEYGTMMIGQFRPQINMNNFMTSFMPSDNNDKAPSHNLAHELMDQMGAQESFEPGYDGEDYYGGDYEAPLAPPSFHPQVEAPKAPAARQAKVSHLVAKEYVMLDPHTVVSGSRPTRKGRTYRLPPSLAKKDTPSDAIKELFSDCIATKNDAWEKYQANQPVSGCFVSSCVLPLLKAKRTVERKIAAMQRLRQKPQVDDDIMYGQEDEGDNYYEGHYAASDPMMNIIYGEERQEENVNQLERDMLQNYENDADYGDEPVITEDAFPEDEEAALARRLEDVLQAQENPYHRSYEMICKQFIENFHRGAEAYAKESQLARRVSEWTYRLEPILQAQEEAKPFDIHECSDEVLQRLSTQTKQAAKQNKDKKGSVVAFEEITEGTDDAGVCRMFLACLQLANLGNVEIMAHTTKEVSTCNEFKLKLLSGKRHNGIENFKAPSLVE